MFTARLPFTPSPSPPSSPTPCIDSSPPSSPSYDPFIVDPALLPEPQPIQLLHPFAASAKATRTPPQYEKKRTTPPLTPYSKGSSKKPRHLYRQLDQENILDAPCSPSSVNEDFAVQTAAKALQQLEAAIWDEASTNVVDNGHGAVTLNDLNLTHIPQSFITDLAKFYTPPESFERLNSSRGFCVMDLKAQPIMGARPLTRASTAPAINGDNLGTRLFSRTRSIANASFGLPREELQLFLSSNKITRLPLELLELQNLGVLAIRSNLLTYIPPQIVHLKHLHTLNIANNKIKFLPAEMLKMSLTQLQVHPNPFLEPPPPPPSDRRLRPFLRSLTASRTNLWAAAGFSRPVSEAVHTLPRVTPLVELSLRVLVSPPPSLTAGKPDETTLEAFFDLPLDECPPHPSDPAPPPHKQRFCYPIPMHLREILDVCVPRSVYCDYDYDEQGVFTPLDNESLKVTGIGMCPSPIHKGELRRSTFVRHAEERFSWEQTVAGVSVGGLVPVKWRGCNWGCLDFLDGQKHKEEEGEVVQRCSSDGNKRCLSDVGVDGDMEMEEGVVQVLQLHSMGGFGGEDFED